MVFKHLVSRSVVVPSVLLLGGLFFIACQESSSPDNGGTGGGTASGCDPTSLATAGAIYLAECPEWLGLPTSIALGSPELPTTCPSGSGEGGQAGQAGEPPALRRLCESESNPYLNSVRPILVCLRPLVEDACAADHEEEVRRCLERQQPCTRDANFDSCVNLQEACPALELGTCWWALTGRAPRDIDFVMTCFEEAQSGEACEDRFFRCAWGL